MPGVRGLHNAEFMPSHPPPQSWHKESSSQGQTEHLRPMSVSSNWCCLVSWSAHTYTHMHSPPTLPTHTEIRILGAVDHILLPSHLLSSLLPSPPPGESAVGKSSLVLRFVKGQFHEYQESTIGGEDPQHRAGKSPGCLVL